MLTATIEEAGDVNAALFDDVHTASKFTTVDAAESYLQARTWRSQIYRVVRETPETVAVHHTTQARAVARVGVE